MKMRIVLSSLVKYKEGVIYIYIYILIKNIQLQTSVFLDKQKLMVTISNFPCLVNKIETNKYISPRSTSRGCASERLQCVPSLHEFQQYSNRHLHIIFNYRLHGHMALQFPFHGGLKLYSLLFKFKILKSYY